MNKYVVTTSFAGPAVGAHAAGEVLELSAEDARDLAPFIQPYGAAVIETADRVPDVETADVKSPRRKKG
jgi:hypothetical protein